MQILGIQIDHPYVQAVLIQKTRKNIEIRCFKKYLLSEIDDVKPLYNKDFKGWIASGIASKNLLIRSIELKTAGNRHIEDAVAFQSEATSHLNLSEMIVVSSLEKKKEGSTQAILFTVPREALRAHLAELQKLQIDPDGISTIGSAICCYLRWKIPALSDAFIVDLGSSEWSCISMANGMFKKSYSIAGGTESLLEALWEDRKKILLLSEIEGTAKQFDLLLLKPHLNPHFTVKLNELRRELAKAMYSFHRDAGSKPILFTGRVDAFSHFTEFLIDGFKEAVDPEFSHPLTVTEQKLAACTGLALERAFSRAFQFRIEEFFPQKNWKRLGFYSLSLLFFSFLVSSLLLGLGMRSNALKRTMMAHSLESSLERWDPALKKKIFPSGPDSESLEESIDLWISEIEKNNKDYPYILQTPKAAEVLAWLSCHPLLNQFVEEGDPIRIAEIHYQLVQFPKIGSIQEPYLGKVEIEFQFKEAMNARKFHDALLKGDDLVDAHQDIAWEALNSSYRVSFYLKNRSLHVP